MNQRAIENNAFFLIIFMFSVIGAVLVLSYFTQELQLFGAIYKRSTCDISSITQQAIAINLLSPILGWMQTGMETVSSMVEAVADIIEWMASSATTLGILSLIFLIAIGVLSIAFSGGAATPIVLCAIVVGAGSISLGGLVFDDWYIQELLLASEMSGEARDVLRQYSDTLSLNIISGSSCGDVAPLSAPIPTIASEVAGLVDKCYYTGGEAGEDIICTTLFIEPEYAGYSESLSPVKKVDECAVTYFLANPETYGWSKNPGNAVCEICDSHGTWVSQDSPSTFCKEPEAGWVQDGDTLKWDRYVCKDGMLDAREYCIIEISYSSLDNTVHVRGVD